MGGEVMVLILCRRLREEVGVSIFVSEVFMVDWMCVWIFLKLLVLMLRSFFFMFL